MASLFRALSRTPLMITRPSPSVSPVSRHAPSQFIRNFSFGAPTSSSPITHHRSSVVPTHHLHHGAIWSSLNTSTCFSPQSSLAIRSLASPMNKTQRRFNSLQPKRMKYRKKHKGKIPIPIGGSTKGTYVEFGDYGLRIKDGARLTAKQIQAAHTTIRRKIKAVKGSQIWTRVFPDIPVTSKGGESRMGKGKGSVDYFATRVGINRIIFEIGGGGIRREHAKEALRLASTKLPVPVEFVVKADQIKPPKIPRAVPGSHPAATTASSTTPAAVPTPVLTPAPAVKETEVVA
ncbi:mitochondrial ribosomal large subunit component [Podila humilis]|nr:mitochondrial ribosomal large subunit component [Podila humilis]